MGLNDKYKEAWTALIAPERYTYDKGVFGPKYQFYDNQQVTMEEFRIRNKEDNMLEGNVWYPSQAQREPTNFVIYLHTRGGCRLEGLFLEKVMLPKMGLVLFDFAGSGYSEGDYITLGAKESKDIRLVIDYLIKNYNVGKIVLWGRSMGAVAAILYAQDKENQDLIDGLILDSPFSSFRKMIYDVISSKVKLPTCLIDMVLYFLLKTIKKKTGVALNEIKPIKLVSNIKIPGFFLVCKDDIIAKPDKVKDLYVNYGCKLKEFHLIPGEHQTSRENKVIVSAIYFMLKCFDVSSSPRNKKKNEGRFTNVMMSNYALNQ